MMLATGNIEKYASVPYCASPCRERGDYSSAAVVFDRVVLRHCRKSSAPVQIPVDSWPPC
jgi:hypothetical protein